MTTKFILALVFSAIAIVLATAWYADGLNQGDNNRPKPYNEPLTNEEPAQPGVFGEEQARSIAKTECIKGGEALGPGTYNEITGTWWFDANLNATQPGCNPACVVSEETKRAEINWRCTGAIPPVPETNISNFEECVAAGNAVMETYPRQCNANGFNFVEQTQEAIVCSEKSRETEVCAQIYDPVCAEVEIQCIKAPCQPVWQNFANPCEACMNPMVKAYVSGGCRNFDKY